ncbi:MAG: hypothetical protein KUG73_09190 [Pseudomonadales bacterium]|nr:hypothetical protein [Pseudomonadales bacterium]
MLKTSSKIVGACALTSLLSGCTWYTQLAEPTAHRESRVGQFEAEPEYRYLQRFDALQQRIEALERENHRLRSPQASGDGESLRHNNAVSAITPHKVDKPEVDKQNDVISQVKLKVSEAVLAIDNVLSQLTAMSPMMAETEPQAVTASSAEIEQVSVSEDSVVSSNNVMPDVAEQEAELVASLNRPNGAVTGSLARNEDGEVVRSTADVPNSKSRFNYSVVYSYPDASPWSAMWNALESADVNDKWRGVNKRKPAYFIYVGAYVNERDAANRQQNLLTVTGEEPLLRKRAINRAVAAN